MISTRTPCDDCILWQLFGSTMFCGLHERDDDPQPRPFVPHPPKIHRHMGHAEQLGRWGGRAARKFEKRRANRLRRRAERLDPENAPIRLIRGWND